MTRAASQNFERRLQIALCDLLRLSCRPEWFFSHLASGEFRTPATAQLLARMGVRRGLPDMMLLGPSGVCFIELKRPGGKPTPEQSDFINRCHTAGIPAVVVDSFDAAVAALKSWGVLSDRVRVQ